MPASGFPSRVGPGRGGLAVASPATFLPARSSPVFAVRRWQCNGLTTPAGVCASVGGFSNNEGMNMDDKLKPCPFCGGRFAVHEDASQKLKESYAYCLQCLAQGPFTKGGAFSAVAAWNRRAPKADKC